MNATTQNYLKTLRASGQASRLTRDTEADKAVKAGRKFTTVQNRSANTGNNLLDAAMSVYVT